MNADRLLDVANYARRLLIENGTEIYRVKKMMVRLCTSLSEVEDTQSFVTTAGVVFSVTVASKTHTKILRVYTRGMDLDCIDKINSLSREAAVQSYTIEELALKLREIRNEQCYSFWIVMFFGALSAGGFAVFFGGNYLEAGCSFLVGPLIRAISVLMEQHGLHDFFMNAIAAASGAFTTLGARALRPDMGADILIVSSIMLFVLGLVITNAIRDTASGDYLSGIACATEAFPVAIAIVAGIGVILSMSIGLNGGM